MEKIYNNPEINYLKIVDYLGIEKGDTILVSSDLLNLFSKEFETTGNLPDVNKFIDSFIELGFLQRGSIQLEKNKRQNRLFRQCLSKKKGFQKNKTCIVFIRSNRKR